MPSQISWVTATGGAFAPVELLSVASAAQAAGAQDDLGRESVLDLLFRLDDNDPAPFWLPDAQSPQTSPLGPTGHRDGAMPAVRPGLAAALRKSLAPDAAPSRAP